MRGGALCKEHHRDNNQSSCSGLTMMVTGVESLDMVMRAMGRVVKSFIGKLREVADLNKMLMS